MAPTLHFVRHAQGFHNLSVANHAMHDPLLTPYGKQQCEYLSKTFPYTDSIDMIVASPLKRTIYTALYSFPEVIAKRQITVVALPELQETSNLPCDTGSDPDELSREFSGMPVDLSLVHNGWNNKQDRWAPTSAKIEERSQKAREWLRDQKASSIVVVTHGGLLHYLTEDWSDMDKTQGTGWANTEFRSYTYSPVSNKKDDAYATIVETEESRVRRRGLEKPLSPAEQTNLRRTANNDLKEGNVTNSNAVKIASKNFQRIRLNKGMNRDWIGSYDF